MKIMTCKPESGSPVQSCRPTTAGFSLIEVTIAMGIFGGSILVLMGLTAITTEFALTNREMTAASQLAAKVFTDLSQPQSGAANDDRNRILNPPTSPTTPYGAQIAPATERYDNTPFTWVFSENLSAISIGGTGSSDLYENGSDQLDGRYLVGLSFADESRYQTAGTAPTAPVTPPAGTGVVKRVMVSVEAPAHLARQFRRKYEFYKIMEFR
ncbi:hypothetical protein [Verrucomicrobium sp. BvORR034]|jgi:type II secretory pathway pseudopilin PulG|uniref:type IV pilus modification PilV family protein n=1 Tax=Verrucomicrobium sp. BvORR034 TaxID=1396418 RepID=UPI000678E925|nr:hypothetical protein [Verrucomicrobium sp. BvORR034]